MKAAVAYGAVRRIFGAVGVALDGRGVLVGVGPLIVVYGNGMGGCAAAGRSTPMIGSRRMIAGIRPGRDGTAAAIVPRSRTGRSHAHASVSGVAAIVIGIGGFVVFGEILVMLLEGGSALVLVVLG